MGAEMRLLALVSSLFALWLGLAALARAQSPTPGGTVPSILSLSLADPGPFRRVGRTRSGENLYVSTIRAEVTASDVPTSLGLGFEGPPLWLWSEPLAAETAKIRLRKVVPDRRALRNLTVLVTLTAGGP